MTRIMTKPRFLLILLIAPIADVAVGQELKEYARSFSQSFNDFAPNRKDMMPFGPDAARSVRYETDGLRIALPPGYQGKRPEIGFGTRFPVRGDFEITLAFEILQETPSAEPDIGARIGLSVILNTPADNMATFSRRAAAAGTEFVTWRSMSAEPNGPTEAATKVIKTKAKSGRLRMVRSGDNLFYFAAEGDDPEFKLLNKTTLRKEDLKTVRFFAATGDKDAAVDVRFTRLRIRADAFLPPPAISLDSTPKLVERVEYLFREGIANRPELHLLGADAGAMVSIQPEGLRFQIPAGRKNPGEVGVESKLRLRGDFQITLEYQIHAFPESTPKLGAGAVLQISLDTPDSLKARMSRAQRPSGSVFTANYLLRRTDGKEEYHGLTAPPANPKSAKGKLRLVRVGNMLLYQIDEGGGFRVIARKEVGLADVIAVRGMCATGWEPVAMEVQFPSLELRATEMPDKIAAIPEKVAAIEPAKPTHMEYQLRDGIAKYPTLRFVGPDAESMAVAQPLGLRFNVPVGRSNPNDVGLESLLRLRGDFEITLEYELVSLPKEPPPLGVGAVLQIVLDTPDGPKARMDRLHRPSDAVFGANYILKDDFRGLMAVRRGRQVHQGPIAHGPNRHRALVPGSGRRPRVS